MQDFDYIWQSYLSIYDAKAEDYLQEMSNAHSQTYEKIEEDSMNPWIKVQKNLESHFSVTLLTGRAREKFLVKSKRYADAAECKRKNSSLEKRETEVLNKKYKDIRDLRLKRVLLDQQKERRGTVLRIRDRRNEHLTQRELDRDKITSLMNKNWTPVPFFEEEREERPLHCSRPWDGKISRPYVNYPMINKAPGHNDKDSFECRQMNGPRGCLDTRLIAATVMSPEVNKSNHMFQSSLGNNFVPKERITSSPAHPRRQSFYSSY